MTEDELDDNEENDDEYGLLPLTDQKAILAEEALKIAKEMVINTHEALQNFIPEASRQINISKIINIGKERNRVIVGTVPYGVSIFKSRLVSKGFTPQEAAMAVAQLKADQRLHQVGRGLGKLLVIYSGPPAEVNEDKQIATPAPMLQILEDTISYTPLTIAWDKIVPTAVVGTLSTAAQEYLVDKIPRITIKEPNVVNNAKKITPHIPVAEYGDLQELYEDFQALFTKLQEKCEELKEENMILNQATWQA